MYHNSSNNWPLTVTSCKSWNFGLKGDDIFLCHLHIMRYYNLHKFCKYLLLDFTWAGLLAWPFTQSLSQMVLKRQGHHKINFHRWKKCTAHSMTNVKLPKTPQMPKRYWFSHFSDNVQEVEIIFAFSRNHECLSKIFFTIVNNHRTVINK